MTAYRFNAISLKGALDSHVYRVGNGGIAYGAANVVSPGVSPESFEDNANSIKTTPFLIDTATNTYYTFSVKLNPTTTGYVVGGTNDGAPTQNFSGVIAGVYPNIFGAGPDSGMFTDNHGKITLFPRSASSALYPEAVSNSGIVAGIDFYAGKIFTYSNGKLTETAIAAVPNNPPTSGVRDVDGVNNKGDVIGTVYTNNGATSHVFLQMNNGRYSQLPDIPNATWETVSSINNSDVIVGSFSDGVRTHGFLYDHGKLSQIDAPNSYSTYLYAINNSGEIGGSFYPTGSNGPQAFVADTHAPSAGNFIGIANDIQIVPVHTS